MNFLTASVDIKVDDSKLSSQLTKAKRAVTNTVDKIKGSFSRMATSFKNAFNKMVHYAKLAGIAIAAYLTLSVKAFATFEEQLANVSTMLDDQTMKYMSTYEKALKSMAVEFGEGTATLSKGLYDILSASVAPNKAIEVLTVSVKAAKAGMTDTAVAADAITTILNSYGLSAGEAGRVSDILFAIVKRGKLNFGELASSIGTVAAIASTAGLSFEQVGAAIATMTRAGLKADLAMTSLRAMINTFLKPTDEAILVAKQFGFEMNSTTLKTIGLTGVLEKLKGATAEQLTALMPNIRGLAGFAAALKQADQMAEDLDLMLNALGLTQQAYDKMTNTLVHSFRRFWQAIKIASVQLGSYLAPAVKEITDEMRELITAFKDDYRIKKWALTFANYVLYIKDIVWAFVKFLASDWKSGIKTSLDISIELFKAFGDMLVLIVSNAAIRAYNMFVRNLFAPIKEALLDLTTFRVSIGKKTVWEPTKGLQENIKSWAPGEVPVPEIGPALDKRLKEMGASIRDIVPNELGTAFDDASEKLKSNLEEIKKTAEETKQPIEDAFVETPQEAIEAVNDLSDTVDNLSEVTEKSDDALKQWASSAKNVWGNVKNIAVSALDGMSDALANFVVKGQADFKSLAESIIMDLTRMIIKAQMAQALGLFLPGLFGTGGAFNLAPVGTAANPMVVTTAPGLQHGGEVAKTGLAVVHKGETFSGVNNENKPERSVNVSLTINAIDTQSGMQFLAGHKRFLANLMRSVTKENVGRRG